MLRVVIEFIFSNSSGILAQQRMFKVGSELFNICVNAILKGYGFVTFGLRGVSFLSSSKS